jgi:hypothetical protein
MPHWTDGFFYDEKGRIQPSPDSPKRPPLRWGVTS